MQEDMKNTNHMRTALLFALSWSLVSSCSIIKGEELKRFDCTLQTFYPNPTNIDFKGKATDYYLYNKEKNEITHIGYKLWGREGIENKVYPAYERDGKILWVFKEEGKTYNNYLTTKTLKLELKLYDGKSTTKGDFACKKVKE